MTTKEKTTIVAKDHIPTILNATDTARPTFKVLRTLGINAMTKTFREIAYDFNLEKEIDEDIRFGIEFIPDYDQMYFGRLKNGVRIKECGEDQDAHDYDWFHIDGDDYYQIQNIDVEMDHLKWMIHKYNVQSNIKEAEQREDYERCASLKWQYERDDFQPTRND